MDYSPSPVALCNPKASESGSFPQPDKRHRRDLSRRRGEQAIHAIPLGARDRSTAAFRSKLDNTVREKRPIRMKDQAPASLLPMDAAFRAHSACS